MQKIDFGPIPTYAALLAAYPTNGAALAALPAGSRYYVEDMQCDVVRSANGKFWIPMLALNGPVPDSPADGVLLWKPANCTTLSSTNAQARNVCRTTFWKMPGNRPATIKGFQVYVSSAAVIGAGSNSIDVRLYECYPDGRPIRSRAPLYVWSFNGTGTGTGAVGIGTGTPGLLDLTAGVGTWLELAVPGGNRDAPPQFLMTVKHDAATTPPGLTCPAQNSFIGDSMPLSTPADASAGVNHSIGYTWTEGSFTLGEFAVFSASAEHMLTSAQSQTVLLDLVG